MRDHAGGVVGRGGERGELELVQVDWVKDVPSVLGEKQVQLLAREGTGREGGKETLIVSSQLNDASVMNSKMARMAHLVSGSDFPAISF